MSIRLDGIDVSHWQEDKAPIDWDQVKAAGVWWGATKLTQSVAYLDKSAARTRREMARVGLRHRGLYHWLSPTTDPAQQARWFLACTGTLTVGEFVMLDAEENGVTIAKCVAWCEAVEHVTRRPVAVYTGAYVAGIWTSPAVRNSIYGIRPMILAAYTTEARARALPGVAANPWHAWQYSSDGPVPGVTGRCDMDRVDNVAVFDIAAGLNIPTKPEPPKPVHPPIDDGEDMPIVSNAEPWADQEATKVKFLVTASGGLRHLSFTEWKARGSDEGVPLTNAEISELGAG